MRSAVRAEFRAALSAIGFLTTLPVPHTAEFDAADFARAAPLFPLVGGAVGVAVGGTAALLADLCPPLAAAAIALALGAVLTGALHLDGLADTADSFGAASRERALAIMRDPRSGAYGVSALTLLLIVEAGALASLAEHKAVTPVIAAFALARCTAPALAFALPYVREAGRGQALGGVTSTRALAGGVVAGVLTALLVPGGPTHLVVTTGGCSLVALVVYRRRFGGVTGDLLGAVIAVTEAACLVVAAHSD